MSDVKTYIEDGVGVSSRNTASFRDKYNSMIESCQAGAVGNPFQNASKIGKNKSYMSILQEASKIKAPETANAYQKADINAFNTIVENVGMEMLNEATSTATELSPIMINSFGIQERALICPHLPRAVKNIVAKIDNFKLTERIPYIIDLNGTKSKFIDAFTPDANGTPVNIAISETQNMGFAIPSTDIDLYLGNNTGNPSAPDYRPAVNKNNIFGTDSELVATVIAHTATAATGTWQWDVAGTATEAKVVFGADSLRNPSAEDGTFRVTLTWKEYDVTSATVYTEYDRSAIIMGQFAIPDGKLITITTNNNLVTHAKFKMVLSPETHNNAISVGYEIKHTPVQIPVGTHYEYTLSEEFKDASDKYYNVDAMARLTDYMGQAVEQVKDIVTLKKYQELADNAIVKTVFNCTPTSAFAQGKEEFIRREFCPFMEKVCIILKNKVRINDCHFRVLGNPLDIRLPAAGGVEYIYKRNEAFAGEIALDYEFSVTSDVHKIYYISSERVPVGKIFVFLIPNTIENNISTVNHYEYATYVSNKYRSAKQSNLPTVMISTRYLTKEYFPVVGVVTVNNNLDETGPTTATGAGLADAIYAKVKYVNA